MKQSDIESLRDCIIEALVAVAPQLLLDPFTLEGVLRLVVREVRDAVTKERAARLQRMRGDAANLN